MINATELMRRKSSQIAKVQPATMAKLAFSTLVITGFIVLYPLLSFFPVSRPLSAAHHQSVDLQVAYCWSGLSIDLTVLLMQDRGQDEEIFKRLIKTVG